MGPYKIQIPGLCETLSNVGCINQLEKPRRNTMLKQFLDCRQDSCRKWEKVESWAAAAIYMKSLAWSGGEKGPDIE